MCSILVWTNPKADPSRFKEALFTTTSRGPDDSRVLSNEAGLMGFNRLAIMGLTASGMQPFTLDQDMLVCNGEIYGFRPLKDKLEGEGYRFVS